MTHDLCHFSIFVHQVLDFLVLPINIYYVMHLMSCFIELPCVPIYNEMKIKLYLNIKSTVFSVYPLQLKVMYIVKIWRPNYKVIKKGFIVYNNILGDPSVTIGC